MNYVSEAKQDGDPGSRSACLKHIVCLAIAYGNNNRASQVEFPHAVKHSLNAQTACFDTEEFKAHPCRYHTVSLNESHQEH